MIKRIFRHYFPSIFYKYSAYRRLICDKNSILYTTGWFDSFKSGMVINSNGQHVPWMTYSIVELLNERLTKDITLFEYGSGYSTKYYAARVGRVVSVEYDLQWLNYLQSDIPDNVNLIFRDADTDGKYCRTIADQAELFDVVIVDGRDRVNCVKQSFCKVSDRGVIILDDAQQDKYTEAVSLAQNAGFKVLNFSGLKPLGMGLSSTVIFYRNNNCLGI